MYTNTQETGKGWAGMEITYVKQQLLRKYPRYNYKTKLKREKSCPIFTYNNTILPHFHRSIRSLHPFNRIGKNTIRTFS